MMYKNEIFEDRISIGNVTKSNAIIIAGESAKKKISSQVIFKKKLPQDVLRIITLNCLHLLYFVKQLAKHILK